VIGERRPIPGWTTFNPGPGFMAIDYLPAGDPGTLIHVDDEGTSGCRAFFGGGPTPGTTAAFQTIDVSGAAAEIDANSVEARMTARVGRLSEYHNHGQVKFEFLSELGEIANKVVKLEDAPVGLSRLQTVTATTDVLVGTRRIVVRVLGVIDEEEGEAENTGYVDDVALSLDGSDPAAVTPTEGCKGGTASTGSASEITATSARVSGIVSPGTDLTRYRFEYGPTTAYGSNSASGEELPRLWEFTPYFGPVPMLIPPSAVLTGLQPGTTYHYRLVAESPKPGGAGLYVSPSLGADGTFRTLSADEEVKVSRSISIRHSAAKSRFSGKIGSSKQTCRVGKVKLFRVRKGTDPKVGGAQAGAGGKWSLKKEVAEGRYYATATAKGDCPAAKSRVLKLG
jgi:hypothetical protein